jgi:CMP-N-acetylneuraminic acid synthetase
MYNNSLSIALIPMRGGSKSIPKKNIIDLNGKPLFFWSISAAIASGCIDEIFVSSDSDEILTKVKEFFPDVKLIKRPAHLAEDTTSTEAVVDHFNSLIAYDIMTLIQITSPLVKAEDFKQAHKKFEKDSLDSLFTGVHQKRFIWSLDAKPVNYNPAKRPRRQDFDGFVVENGAFYIFTKENYTKYSNRLGGKIGYHLMHENNLFELDESNDLQILKLLMTLE